MNFVQHSTKPSLLTMGFNPKCVKIAQNPELGKLARSWNIVDLSVFTENKNSQCKTK